MMNNSSIIVDKIRAFQRTIRFILIILSAFFATWGSGLQKIANFDLSKIFVGLASLLIFYWWLFVRYKFRVFPRYFNYFILFVFIHTLITYGLIFPEELKFGYMSKIALQNGFIRLQESNGMIIIRFFLFALFGYALASLLKTEKELIGLSLAYGAGLAAVMMIGGYLSGIRLCGGVLDPNAFGLSTVIAIFLNMIVLNKQDLKVWIKIISVIFIIFAIIGILWSGSRGAILGAFIGLLVLLIYLSTIKRRIQIIIGLLMISIIVFLFLPRINRETIKSRVSFEGIQKFQGEERLSLWRDYLGEVHRYAIIGVGMNRSLEVTKNFRIPKQLDPHNNYLETWVEFGIMGFILFILGLYKMWYNIHFKKMPMDASILGLFTAWLTISFFMSNFTTRDTWIVLGIAAAYGSMKSKFAGW